MRVTAAKYRGTVQEHLRRFRPKEYRRAKRNGTLDRRVNDYYRVTACTERLIGRPINPHLFRDCAATFIAQEAPEEVRIISKILGRSDLSTAEQYYNQAGMISAGRRYHQALDEFRGEPD